MKIKMSAVALASAIASFGYAGVLSAQTCASPTPYNTPISGPTASGTTCGASDEVNLFCGGINSSGKPDVVFQVSLGPSRTATQITVSDGGSPTSGYTPTLIMYSDACATANSCVATGDTSTPADITSVADGTYFLTMTAGNSDASGACGSFAITANGTLPVKLQNFSIN